MEWKMVWKSHKLALATNAKRMPAADFFFDLYDKQKQKLRMPSRTGRGAGVELADESRACSRRVPRTTMPRDR